jgi:hypothetical protein
MVQSNSNSTEALFVIISLYFWAQRQKNKYYDVMSRFVVIVGFLIRFTIIFFWGIIWPY